MSFVAWNPSPEEIPSKQLPVTVLSGFLGAGKTTLLNHILKQSAGTKIAVIVNDLGEINIDASLIRSAVKEVEGAIAGILELQGGCICCSIQTDLLDALLELWQNYRPEHIIIEATGVAEPKAILETIYSGNSFGLAGIDFLRIANMVTVIDGSNLETYLESPENTGHEKRNHILQSDPRVPLQELLMEQIECADILLINKADCLNAQDCNRFKSYLRSLNHNAEIWESRFGRIDVAMFMQDHRFSQEKTLSAAGWKHAILENEQGRKSPGHRHEHVHNESSHTHHHKDYGLETFIFNARTPFDAAKLLKLLRGGLPGLLRAKGFYWTIDYPTRVGLLSITGKILRADYLAEWWHTMIERGDAQIDEMPELVHESWLPVYGDRRQELVFIGIDLDRIEIEKALKACFTDKEFDVSNV